jgi:hypothetical protein
MGAGPVMRRDGQPQAAVEAGYLYGGTAALVMGVHAFPS